MVQSGPLPFQEAADGRIASERLEQLHLTPTGCQVRGAHSLGWNVLGMPQLEAQSFPQRQRCVNGFDCYCHVPQPCLFTHAA